MSSYEPDSRAVREELSAFADHLHGARAAVLDRWRASGVEAAEGGGGSREKGTDRVARLLDALDAELRAYGAHGEADPPAPRARPRRRVRRETSLEQSVRELGALRVALAEEVARYRDATGRLRGVSADVASIAITRVLNTATDESVRSHSAARASMADELERTSALVERQAASRSRFISTVAHELRSPLNVIAGVAQILVRNREALGPHARLVEMLDRNVDGLARLLNDLVDYARLTAGEDPLRIETFRPRLVLESIADAARVEASAQGLEIVVDSGGAPESVATDRVKFGRIVANLLTNAVKVTGKGGVLVRMRDVGDDRWCVEVSDAGPEIAPHELPKVFDEFARVGRFARADGAGLGLPIARRLAEALGGTLEATSRPGGEGATFRLLLPVESGERESSSGPQENPTEEDAADQRR